MKPLNSTPSNIEPPKLLDLVRGKIHLKHYSVRTEHAQVDWIKSYFLHYDKRNTSFYVVDARL